MRGLILVAALTAACGGAPAPPPAPLGNAGVEPATGPAPTTGPDVDVAAARAAYERGRAAFDARDFAAAARAFHDAYALAPRVELLFDAGLAYLELARATGEARAYARARTNLTRYADEAPAMAPDRLARVRELVDEAARGRGP